MKYMLCSCFIIAALFATGCQVTSASKEGWQKIPGAAYTSKGKVELGGDVGYTYSHQENDNTSTLTRAFSLDHIIGYCVTDNIELEFRPFCMYEKTITRDKTGINPTSYEWSKGAGGGPAVTYNFPSSGNIVPFATAGYGAIDFRYEQRGVITVADTVPVAIGILGLKIFSGDSGCVRIGASYTEYWFKKDIGAKSEFGLTLGYSIFF
jgi:hypothetical protein